MFELEAYAQDQSGQIPNNGEDGITPPPPNAGGGFTQMLMMFGVIAFIFYFLLIRPEKRKKDEQERKINALKKGDRIVTAGGIYGSIIGIKDDVATIKISENKSGDLVKIEIMKSAISTILEEEKKDNKQKG